MSLILVNRNWWQYSTCSTVRRRRLLVFCKRTCWKLLTPWSHRSNITVISLPVFGTRKKNNISLFLDGLPKRCETPRTTSWWSRIHVRVTQTKTSVRKVHLLTILEHSRIVCRSLHNYKKSSSQPTVSLWGTLDFVFNTGGMLVWRRKKPMATPVLLTYLRDFCVRNLLNFTARGPHFNSRSRS